MKTEKTIHNCMFDADIHNFRLHINDDLWNQSVIKSIRLFALAMLCVAAYSCSKGGVAQTEMRVIDVANAETAEIRFDMPDGQSTPIALETDTQSLIQDVTRIYVNDSYIFIFDKPSQQLLQFDKSGKFIRNMCRKGRGPNELIEIRDVVLKDDLLYLHGLGRNMLTIDMDGNVVENKSLSECDFISSYPADDGRLWAYMYSDNDGHRGSYLSLLDEDMNVVDRWQPKNEKSLHIVYPEKNFYETTDGSLYFFHHMTDVISRLDGRKATPAFRFDFGDKNPDYEAINLLWQDNEIAQELEGRVSVNSMMFIGDFILFSYSKHLTGVGVPLMFGAYDIANDKTYVSQKNIAIPFYMNSVTDNATVVYRVISPHRFNDEALREFSKRCGKELSADDNPLIIPDTLYGIKFQ